MRRWIQKPPLGVKINWFHPLARGLVACWLMNEDGGNKIYDLSGNQNNGTLYGDTKKVPGKFGSCLSFDGVGDYIATTPVPFGNDNSLTFSAWIYLTGADFHVGTIVCKEGGYSGAADFRVYANYELYLVNSSITNIGHNNTSLLQNIWYHAVVTYDGTNYAFYLNGIPDGSGVNVQDFTYKYIDAIGHFYSAYQEFNGKIDNVMIFNRALTASEVTKLYREPFAMFNNNEVWGI